MGKHHHRIVAVLCLFLLVVSINFGIAFFIQGEKYDQLKIESEKVCGSMKIILEIRQDKVSLADKMNMNGVEVLSFDDFCKQYTGGFVIKPGIPGE